MSEGFKEFVKIVESLAKSEAIVDTYFDEHVNALVHRLQVNWYADIFVIGSEVIKAKNLRPETVKVCDPVLTTAYQWCMKQEWAR